MGMMQLHFARASLKNLPRHQAGSLPPTLAGHHQIITHGTPVPARPKMASPLPERATLGQVLPSTGQVPTTQQYHQSHTTMQNFFSIILKPIK